MSQLLELNSKVQINFVSSVQLNWLHDVVASYRNDQFARGVIIKLSTGEVTRDQWQYVQGLLKYQGKTYVGNTGNMWRKLLQELHAGVMGGHWVRKLILRRIKQFFFWPIMKNYVTLYV